MKWGWYWTMGTSASRHFSFRQPCLSTSVPPVCSFFDVRSAVQLDLLVDGGWQHLDLAARGRGSIGKARYGADQSVRRLLVGGKARNGAFSVAPSRGAPRTPRAWGARARGTR